MSDTPDARVERIKELFASAMSVGPAARVAVLDEACTGDAELRRAVEELLDNYDSAQEFFRQFPPNFAREALGLAAAPRAFSPGDLVAGRFHIVGFLGAGGMAEVYEAEDQLLDRQRVALKTLPADVAGDTMAIVRLQREMALARQVTHLNVCRVFDVDQHVTSSGAAIAFFTMELLKGETLAERLQRTGPLSTTDARPLVRQMVAALSTAHAAGIVHGDFKPGNVVIVPSPEGGERLVVTDFGLARRAPMDPASRSTNSVGPAWGTPRYMAPEQFAGRRATRATDVYALAAVVLEMITGKQVHPFETHAADEKSAVSIPEGIVDPAWPSWRSAIRRGLDHNPEARFQTVDELLSALSAGDSRPSPRWRWVAGVAGLSIALVLLVLAVRSTLQGGSGAIPLETHKNVAVLPFTNADGTPDGDAFARGLGAAIADQLGAVSQGKPRLLFVPTVDMIGAAGNSPVGRDEAHRANRILGADMVVTGRVDGATPSRHITIDLYDASPQPPTLIATRPVEIAEGSKSLRSGILPLVRTEVARMLGMSLAQSMAVLDTRGTRPAEAEDWYVRGRGYLERGRARLDVASLDSAIGAFQQAIALDRSYAEGHAALGEAFLLKYRATQETGKDEQLLNRAEQSADDAYRLQPTVARFRVARAMTYLAAGRYTEAIAELKEALRIDPDDVRARESLAKADAKDPARVEQMLEDGIKRHPRYWSAHEGLGVFRLNQGQYDQAQAHLLAGKQYAPDNPRTISNLAALYTMTEHFVAAQQELKRGLELGPDPFLYNNLGWAYYYDNKYPEGLDSMKEAVRLKTDDSVMLAGLARGYRWTGHPHEALTAYRRAIAVALEQIGADPANVEVRANLAYLYAENHDRGEAGRQIGRALEDAPTNARVRFTSALVFELTGRRQDALDTLKSEIDLRHSMYLFSHHPDLRALRTDDRYVELMGRVKQ